MFWKTLGGRCIYQANGISVRQNMLYRWLRFDSTAIQTLINRRHPERFALEYIPLLTLAARMTPAPACLLGLGGAGVAHALTTCAGEYALDAVESSQDVIDIAAAWFMTDRIKNLSIIHQDASLFVHNTVTRYQHLMVDLSDAQAFPAHCNNPDFFKACQRILFPKGILAVNLANQNEHWPILLLIKNAFQQAIVSLPVTGTGNMIVLACKNQSIKPLLTLVKQHPRLKRFFWDTKWGYVAELRV